MADEKRQISAERIARELRTYAAYSGSDYKKTLENMAQSVEALQQRVGELQAALRSALRIMDYWSTHGREVTVIDMSDAIEEVGQALHQEPGEGGGDPLDDLAQMSATARALQVGVDQPEPAPKGECPHGCKDGWIIDSRPEYGMPGPRVDRHRLCPIHGAGRNGDQ